MGKRAATRNRWNNIHVQYAKLIIERWLGFMPMMVRAPLTSPNVTILNMYLGTRKISDLQRRLDAQYDRIDEVEKTMTEFMSLRKIRLMQIAYTDF